MLQDNIAKQIIDFQKTAFDKSYGAMVMLQDQAQVAFNTVLEQTPWVPEESKKVIMKTLEEFNWNVTRSAEALGINRVTLHKKIKRYGLKDRE